MAQFKDLQGAAGVPMTFIPLHMNGVLEESPWEAELIYEALHSLSLPILQYYRLSFHTMQSLLILKPTIGGDHCSYMSLSSLMHPSTCLRPLAVELDWINECSWWCILSLFVYCWLSHYITGRMIPSASSKYATIMMNKVMGEAKRLAPWVSESLV